MRYYWWQKEEGEKNTIDNNYFLPEYTGGTDTTSQLINEIKRLKIIITQHQKEERKYEQELNKILRE